MKLADKNQQPMQKHSFVNSHTAHFFNKTQKRLEEYAIIVIQNTEQYEVGFLPALSIH